MNVVYDPAKANEIMNSTELGCAAKAKGNGQKAKVKDESAWFSRFTCALCLLPFAFCLLLFPTSPLAAQQLIIEPGAVAAFGITAPSSARVGERITLRIVARDAAGNVIKNYASTGGGVILSLPAPLSGGIEPNRFAASSFRDGVLEAAVALTRAGATEILVEDVAARVSSRTRRIDVTPGAPASIKIAVPADARIDEPFEIELEIFDRYGNPVTDFDRTGGEIALRQGLAGGVGKFDPGVVSPAIFSQGRASVRVRYSHSENAVVLAEVGAVRGLSSVINVRAGELFSFAVTVPSRGVIAGEPFGIAIEARDQGGNTLTDYNRTGGVVSLKTTGSGRLEPASVPPTSFSGGIAMVQVRYNTAEKIGIIAEDASGARRGESANRVDVVGGKLGRFEVVPAENARAGAPLAVQIMGYDIFGNFIRDYSGRNVRIILSAADGARLENSRAPDQPVAAVNASSFTDGIALLMVTPTKAGQLVLQVIDDMSGAGGRSAPVKVRAGAVASFAVRSPVTAAAHEPFEIEITAVDGFGNVVADYGLRGAGVVIEKTGRGEISPASVPASAFIDGVARIKMTYNTAEELSLAFVDQSAGSLSASVVRGNSNPILVTHSAPKKFVVSVMSSGSQGAHGSAAVVGEPVKLTIMAVDDYGNPVVSYSAMNRTISLFTENGEPVAPPIFSSAAFKNGVAAIDAVFFRSGDVIVVAEEIGGTGLSGGGGEASIVSGKSSALRVLPARPAQLVVMAPASAEAGSPFAVRVEMRDKLGNKIRDYSPGTASLSIHILGDNGAALSLGGAQASLSDISRMVFREGVAEISLLPQAVGPMTIEVKDEFLQITGKSSLISVTAGPVDNFRVENILQGHLRAGEPMKLRVTAVDAFGNVVADYGHDGSGARLRAQASRAGTASSGSSAPAPASGVFLPSTLRGEAFIGGRADIYAIYDKAEAVDIVVERIAAGSMVRPEVVTSVISDMGNITSGGGALVSLIGNSPLKSVQARRLTDSILELVIPGAILSSQGAGMTRQRGIISMISMMQTEEGVRVLVHATDPAAMRVGAEANRVMIEVEPIGAGGWAGSGSMNQTLVPVAPSSTRPSGGWQPEPGFIAVPNVGAALIPSGPDHQAASGVSSRSLRTGPSGSGSREPNVAGAVPTTADVEMLVRQNRFAEALEALGVMISAKPHDSSLLALKRRLETLISIIRDAGPAPEVNYAPSPFAPLHSHAQDVKTSPAEIPAPAVNPGGSSDAGMSGADAGMAAVEQAVRAGKYRDALAILDRHIASNPQDVAAVRMRIRIEQMIKFLDSNTR